MVLWSIIIYLCFLFCVIRISMKWIYIFSGTRVPWRMFEYAFMNVWMQWLAWMYTQGIRCKYIYRSRWINPPLMHLCVPTIVVTCIPEGQMYEKNLPIIVQTNILANVCTVLTFIDKIFESPVTNLYQISCCVQYNIALV